jgi:hypothetical protein
MRVIPGVLLLLMAGVAGVSAQFNQRQPLTPAETLLDPALLKAIDAAPAGAAAAPDAIAGSDAAAGEIVISCYVKAANSGCAASGRVAEKLKALLDTRQIEPPARTIRFVSTADAASALAVGAAAEFSARVKASIHLAGAEGTRPLQIVRAPWSTVGIADEIVELFARQAPYGTAPPAVDVQPFAALGQPQWDAFGVPTVTMIATPAASDRLVATAAAAAYFLATLPNAGAEALLSHLMVGAHARLAEDGRRAVAQMGTTQRATADVLILLAQAIDREQRRIRSFAGFMPAPLDATLDSRLSDMEKGITGVWSSLGFTSSPYTPPAQRIRGRGGEDRRVPTRSIAVRGPLGPGSPWMVSKAADAAGRLALLKRPDGDVVAYEIVNFIDGTRSISDIRDAVTAEFGPVPLPAVVEYLELLATAGAVTIK